MAGASRQRSGGTQDIECAAPDVRLGPGLLLCMDLSRQLKTRETGIGRMSPRLWRGREKASRKSQSRSGRPDQNAAHAGGKAVGDTLRRLFQARDDLTEGALPGFSHGSLLA
jgi:hypothetical protein